jgi:hypothetical protein
MTTTLLIDRSTHTDVLPLTRGAVKNASNFVLFGRKNSVTNTKFSTKLSENKNEVALALLLLEIDETMSKAASAQAFQSAPEPRLSPDCGSSNPMTCSGPTPPKSSSPPPVSPPPSLPSSAPAHESDTENEHVDIDGLSEGHDSGPDDDDESLSADMINAVDNDEKQTKNKPKTATATRKPAATGVRRRLLCAHCTNADISFSTAVSLRLHTKVMHPNREVRKTDVMRDPELEKHCSNCNTSFEKRRMLLNHRNRCLPWTERKEAEARAEALATAVAESADGWLSTRVGKKRKTSILPAAQPTQLLPEPTTTMVPVREERPKRARQISSHSLSISDEMRLEDILHKLSNAAADDVASFCQWLGTRGLRTVLDLRQLDKPIATEVYNDAPKHYPLRNALAVVYGDFLS